MSEDPTFTDPDKYKVVFENEHVRVLEYTDHPGDRTTQHAHPDSVMYTLSSFHRRLYSADGETRDVDTRSARPGGCPPSAMPGTTLATAKHTSSSWSSRAEHRGQRPNSARPDQPSSSWASPQSPHPSWSETPSCPG